MRYGFGMVILILCGCLWLSIIVLALYEWEFLVAGVLLLLLFVVRPWRPRPVTSRRCATTTKEDDAQ
jgi:hypothetical protein